MNTNKKMSIIAICLLLVQPLMAQEAIKGNLVSVTWLAENLKNNDLLILDANPLQIYTEKHIPGAVNYDIFTYGVRELPLAEIEKRYQSWGISPGKNIVMYDQGGTFMATRLFFSLVYYGYPAENLFILDGGLTKWQEQGLPVTNDPAPIPRKGSFTISKTNNNVKADLPEFLTASGDTRHNVLLEALDPDWHYGGLQFFSKPGHIPNAIMLPTADFFNPDKTFKSSEEIKKILAFLDISPEQNIYTTCGGGIAASVPFFALKYLLNYPSVKLYTGSQLEWIADQRELPVWTYDAPYLMRESQWLNFWGGQMARRYGISNISLIDIQPVAAYHQGHIPFSINIPAENFFDNIDNPDKLVDVLGKVGINADQEAIIISGKGLTRDAALAFLLLEKLGLKKVSVFINSIAQWEQLGFKVTMDSTVADPKQGTGNMAILSTNYSGDLREGIIIDDSNSTKGYYPKVFIASGKNIPATAIEGKVVHLPYADLLNADGTPKAAKDIWKILSQAGVPRYAELVCYSDDPGEAAVTYFILRIMGYPDIKVLAANR